MSVVCPLALLHAVWPLSGIFVHIAILNEQTNGFLTIPLTCVYSTYTAIRTDSKNGVCAIVGFQLRAHELRMRFVAVVRAKRFEINSAT